MTIISKSLGVDFDPDPALKTGYRAQPIAVGSGDAFVILCQRDGSSTFGTHLILVERRDVPALVAALLEN